MPADDVKVLCGELKGASWGDVLAAHGLDLNAADPIFEFTKKQLAVDRAVPGFEDFSKEGSRVVQLILSKAGTRPWTKTDFKAL